jgi:uncharacterized protein YndB with AHSA1/START domain
MTDNISAPARRRITLERLFHAGLDEVWALWTTIDGIESWWGPEGFSVTVRALDLTPGGTMHYVMTATSPEHVAFMKKAGLPLSTEATLTFTDVQPLSRLGYVSQVDFVPSVPPYPCATLVELTATPDGVRMVLTFDAMHDELWTGRAVQGRESELRKLDAVIAKSDQPARSP